MRKRVGVFDSGVGGLSVWREIVHQLPEIDTTYVADQAHLPYGPRPAAEVLSYACGVVRFLIERRCDAIVVACNTASAAALHALRQTFEQIPFIGMEPAVKPAAQLTRRQAIGVLATPTTLEGELFATTAARHARDVRIVRQACPGLVELIEAGELEGERLETLLDAFLEAPRTAGVDTLVLACTHYPFVRPTIERLMEGEIHILDPAPAIAKQLTRILDESAEARNGHLESQRRAHDKPAQHEFFTTGETLAFAHVAAALLSRPVEARAVRWTNEQRLEL